MPTKEMVMKLCAIYTVWGDCDLIIQSMDKIALLVDDIIIIESHKSNSGEESTTDLHHWHNHHWFEPDLRIDARDNETAKRNFGLQIARMQGFTHFIMLDEDEFYDPIEFLGEIKRFEDPKLLGLVCRVKCYFRSPTLTIGYDTTLVPFIHKITPDLKFCFNKEYPFAWTMLDRIPTTNSKQIRIDPTRSLNINNGVEWSEVTMHHMSWLRSDIKKKIRNSTARQNIERSTIVTDYCNAKPGYFCQFYGKYLEETPNVFGLPEIIDHKIDAESLRPAEK
jgi:hypothetical protein